MFGTYPQYNQYPLQQQYPSYPQYPQYPPVMTPAANRLAQMEQGMNGTISQIQKQAQCYFVKSNDELGSMKPQPGVVYIGLNEPKDEIYLRQLNNDGNIVLKTYVLESDKQEPSELSVIMQKVDEITKMLKDNKDERNDTNDDATADVRVSHEQPRHVSV